MAVVVDFTLMPGVSVIVRPMFSCMVMCMSQRIPRVIVIVLVFMQVLVGMGMGMLMRMLRVTMRMFMRVNVGMLVGMQMRVFVVAVHGQLLSLNVWGAGYASLLLIS